MPARASASVSCWAPPYYTGLPTGSVGARLVTDAGVWHRRLSSFVTLAYAT